MLEKWVKEELHRLSESHRLRRLRTVRSIHGPELTLNNRQLICLCSNNYLGIASHEDLIKAAKVSVEKYGLGSAASRLICGNMKPHNDAERALADYVQTEASLLFSSGYAANVGVIQGLLGENDAIFSDELNHASLIDGCRLSKARVFAFPHCNMDALDRLLSVHRKNFRNVMVVSDGLFSMDGDFAHVSSIRGICDKHRAWMMIDEAHSLGIVGNEGRGICIEEVIKPDILIGTLGKSFGLSGAFVAGSKNLIQLILNRARSFIFSTGISPTIAGVIPESVRILLNSSDLRENLAKNTRYFKHGLLRSNFELFGNDSPILGIRIGDDSLVMKISERLISLGVLALGIRPPTVPQGTSRIRLTLMATHSKKQLDKALESFKVIAKEFPEICSDQS